MGERDGEFEELIERSSLGTPGARQLRRRTPRPQVDAVRRIAELRNRMMHGDARESAEATADLVQLLRDLGYEGQIVSEGQHRFVYDAPESRAQLLGKMVARKLRKARDEHET